MFVLSRSFRDYGEAVIKKLENTVDSDTQLLKAPVNYEGVSVGIFISNNSFWMQKPSNIWCVI